MFKTKNSTLEAKRHSLAHLLAAAVLKIYPEAKLAIGPATETGFYYDIDLDRTISDKDLPVIEEKMRELALKWRDFKGQNISTSEAKKLFKNNQYKLELINELEQTGETITIYTSGSGENEFCDLCRGGHVNDMVEIEPGSWQLNTVAGAYWRGSNENKMLTRIYGLAFNDEAELKKYLDQMSEAKKRDHRKLGKELDLFTFSELIGPGLPLFTAKGAAMREAIVNKIDEIQRKYGYQKVSIPHITKPDLYKTSGHWEKFGEELFKVSGKESQFVMKPMNCPHHTQIYASGAKSYKDLPVRMAETTTVYRDEQTGELLGLSRVRSLTQDDGHVFCTPEQTEAEIENIIEVIKEFYTLLGMYTTGNYQVFLSVRDPDKPGDYLGNTELWEEAENTLKKIAENRDLPFGIEKGEAAFYGPKLDFMFQDAIGRKWQLATIQLDFVMPERFDLKYTDKDGSSKHPVMIHRAIAGSLERFLSVIIEHFAGAFPTWLAPIQVAILPVSEDHLPAAKKIDDQLKENGLRSELKAGTDSLGKRIRQTKDQKVPHWLVLGDHEINTDTVTAEDRSGDKNNLTLDEFTRIIKEKEHDGN